MTGVRGQLSANAPASLNAPARAGGGHSLDRSGDGTRFLQGQVMPSAPISRKDSGPAPARQRLAEMREGGHRVVASGQHQQGDRLPTGGR